MEEANYLIQVVVLVLVCLQTAGLSLATSYSQGVKKEKYSSVEVIMVAEAIKFIASGILSASQLPSPARSGGQATTVHWVYKLGKLLWSGKKVIILVVLYSISNAIPLYAISRIGAPIFTVVIQLKVFTTASFATLLLGRKYSAAKWRALLLLIVGCILVASPIFQMSSSSGSGRETSASEAVLGLVAVVVQTLISGFSAVYFESLLKDKDDTTTIWERNFQLAFYSLAFLGSYMSFEVLSLTPLLSSEGVASSSGSEFALFSGWTEWTILIAFLQGAGGLIVAATLKYADAVLKCFATAVSIMIVSIVGYLCLDNEIDLFVALGMLVTVISIFNYTLDYQHS